MNLYIPTIQILGWEKVEKLLNWEVELSLNLFKNKVLINKHKMPQGYKNVFSLNSKICFCFTYQGIYFFVFLSGKVPKISIFTFKN